MTLMKPASSPEARRPCSGRRDARAQIGARMPAMVLMMAAAGMASAQPAPFTFEIVPDSPSAQQDVFARIHLPSCREMATVSHAQGTIAIAFKGTGCFGIPPPGIFTYEVSLGKLPQGEYQVQLVNNSYPVGPVGAPKTLVVAPLPIPPFGIGVRPLLDHSGWWMSADARPGEGWLVEHKLPDTLVFSWVTYDGDGEPMWLNMQAQRQHRAYVGPVYRTQRQGGQLIRTVVGQGSFDAATADAAVFTLTPADPAITPVSHDLRRLRL
jgi:hypothetical protein